MERSKDTTCSGIERRKVSQEVRGCKEVQSSCLVTSISSVEQEMGACGQDEVAVTDRELMGSSSRWGWKRWLLWVAELRWRKPHQCNGVRFSTSISRLNGGHRRTAKLTWNSATRGNLRNCLVFLSSLSHAALDFFPLSLPGPNIAAQCQ